MCQQGETSRRRGRRVDGTEERKRKREGSIFIVQHHITVIEAAALACACFVHRVMARMGTDPKDEKPFDGCSEDRQTEMSSRP